MGESRSQAAADSGLDQQHAEQEQAEREQQANDEQAALDAAAEQARQEGAPPPTQVPPQTDESTVEAPKPVEPVGEEDDGRPPLKEVAEEHAAATARETEDLA